MASKRLTKQEIREDRVVTAATQAIDYARENARVVLAAAALVVIAILAVVFVTQGRVRSQRTAGVTMTQAQSLYFQGDFSQALPLFQIVAEKHGSTPSGRLARLFEGNTELALGNGAAAEKAYRLFADKVKGDPVSQAAAKRGIGASLAQQGKSAEAASAYLEASQITGNPDAASDVLRAARSYDTAGKRDEAVRTYRKLLDEYPISSNASEARIRLQEALSR